MTVGQMRERVRIERPVETQDDTGQPIQTWEEVATVWAAVEPGEPREVWQGRGVQMDGAETVTVRHRADVAAEGGKLRVVVLTQGDRVLNCEGPKRDPGRRWLFLVCRTAGEVA